MNDPNAHRIDDVEKHLYEKTSVSSKDVRRTISASKIQVNETWGNNNQDNDQKNKKTNLSFAQIFFVTALVFVLGAGGFLWFSTLQGRTTLSNENIVLTINNKAFVDGGEDLGFRVVVDNYNAAALELVDMVVEYPLSSDAQTGRDIERIRRPIGSIPANGSIEEMFDIRLFGAEGDQRQMTVTLEYRVAGSNAIFTKSRDSLVSIRSAPVVVTMDAPEQLVAGQDVTLDIDIISNSQDPLARMGLVLEYPSGFTFKQASIEPTYGVNVWDLGTLQPEDIQTISITGSLAGDIGVGRTFRARVGERSETDTLALSTTYSSRAHVVLLEDSFLIVDVQMDGSDDPAVVYFSNDEVRGEITITNTQQVPLSDIRVMGTFIGDLYDPETLRVTRGRFDTQRTAMLWTQDTNSSLDALEVNGTRNLSFSFDFDTEGFNERTNPRMEIIFDIRATSIDGQIFEAQHVASRSLVVNSNAVLDLGTLSSSGPFPNTGPIPPEVGQTTSYTLQWSVRNSSNALSDVVVTTTLPDYVAWTGQVAPATERLEYNPETREIVWDVGGVVQGAGFSAPHPEVYFQLSIAPAPTDASQRVNLTKDIIMTAQDTFTGQQLRSQKSSQTTQLRGDSIEDDGRVQ